ncbi:type II toxin-antitoxin system PemK/MazF family toxin [Miniimonas arenae]|uniref:type II toxin-antitoxin system PemK/MazF family toxin n=1 Tax=Miniimonas arenae TaxID=676201 RepID=UPI001FE51AF0|nr:type II toxin-antitoxin system PemK/MazF family toxin [Miniimonas arenae]
MRATDILRSAARALGTALRPAPGRTRTPPSPSRETRPTPSPSPAGRPTPTRPPGGQAPPLPGGITEYDVPAFGPPLPSYAPDLDGAADPGEIVWGWVPYEEDASKGKDRPMLVVGSGGGALVALQLTSKDRTGDRAAEARRGRYWFDVGTGEWDRKRRDSEVRLDRLLRVPEDRIRREGAILERPRYDAVVAALRELHGW